MNMELNAENPYLEICFRPTISTIANARRFVESLYEPLLEDPDILSRVAVATHELLENSLKYSLDGMAVIRVELSRAKAPCRVKVETRNKVSPERRAGLDEVFVEMEQCGDSSTYYQSAMHRSRMRKHGSGLGLARIWEEGEMQLFKSYEADEVRIVAVAMIPEAA
jgi:two-component sensor histidine kinase